MGQIVQEVGLFNVDKAPAAIQLPFGAELLAVRAQESTQEQLQVTMWFLWDQTETQMITRSFEAFQTGVVVPAFKKYIGTFRVQAPEGVVTWHVFEV